MTTTRNPDPTPVLAPLLEHPKALLVAVDYDGTLAPIVQDPAQATTHPDVVPALMRLAELGVRVAVVTGRPAATAVELGDLSAVSGVVVLGHYGMERWHDGTVTAPDPHPSLAEARQGLAALSEGTAGVHVEDKGHAVAVHTRRAADPGAALEGLRAAVAELAARLGLEVAPGRYVLEVRPAGIDKGSALDDLLADGAVRAVLLAGDDLGDLPAVAALRAAVTDGRLSAGVVVCSDAPEVPAELRDQADVVVDGPAGVAALLSALADALADKVAGEAAR